jgi:hypothetical protein
MSGATEAHPSTSLRLRGDPRLIHADPRAISGLQVRSFPPRARCCPSLDRVTLRHRGVARSTALPALLTHRCTCAPQTHKSLHPQRAQVRCRAVGRGSAVALARTDRRSGSLAMPACPIEIPPHLSPTACGLPAQGVRGVFAMPAQGVFQLLLEDEDEEAYVTRHVTLSTKQGSEHGYEGLENREGRWLIKCSRKMSKLFGTSSQLRVPSEEEKWSTALEAVRARGRFYYKTLLRCPPPFPIPLCVSPSHSSLMLARTGGVRRRFRNHHHRRSHLSIHQLHRRWGCRRCGCRWVVQRGCRGRGRWWKTHSWRCPGRSAIYLQVRRPRPPPQRVASSTGSCGQRDAWWVQSPKRLVVALSHSCTIHT